MWSVLMLGVLGTTSSCSDRRDVVSFFREKLGNIEIAEYNHPELSKSDKSMIISGDGTPAGIFFRRSFPVPQAFRLLIRGEVSQGDATLRVKLDDDEAQYISLNATKGGFEFEYFEVSRIEVLIYSDASFSYRLTDLSITPCTDCTNWHKGFPGIDVALYNLPRIQANARGMTISGDSPPSGVYFQRDVQSDKVYRVTFRGEVEHGPVTLAVRFDNREPRYVPLRSTQGDFEFEISDVHSISLLLYADDSYRYRVDSVAIDPCGSCVSGEALNAQLKSRILTDIPALPRMLKRDKLRAARLLTDWVANNVDQGDLGGSAIQNTALIEVMHPGRIQAMLWDTDAGGTYCQGFATYLDKVFDLFGLQSFVITVGYLGTDLTHVTNILVLDDDRRRRYYLMDPTFSGIFVDAQSGSIVDLETVLSRYSNAGIDGLRVRFATKVIHRTQFFYGDRARWVYTRLAKSRLQKRCRVEETKSYRLTCRDLEYGVDDYLMVWKEELEKRRIDPSRVMETLLLRGGVLSQQWADAPGDTVDFKSLLHRYGISGG